jgi:hypothetical protein
MVTTRQRHPSRPARPHAAPATEPEAGAGLASRISQWATVVAPTPVATAMLLYFGYIGTRARFAYFGVYLDLTELSSRDLVLYGLEVLYLPVAVLFLSVLALALVHLAAIWATARPVVPTRKQSGGTAAYRRGIVLIVAGVVALAGVVLVARAVIGLVLGHVAREEHPGTTALALATGPALLAYACWLAVRVTVHGDGAGSVLPAWYATPAVRKLRHTALAGVAGLALTGLFWAGTSFAWRLGEGRAYDDALQLPQRPEVVLDTGDRLVDLPPFVQESTLPAAPGGKFHYRYRGLRLLLQAGGRLFLVPTYWNAQGRTLIVPYDDSVRLQVIPRPAPRP